MSLDLAQTAEGASRLSPYLRGALERAAEHALRLHADALSPEHLVHVLLDDEESALHRLAVHAFADPETIAADVLAISPGILVVGSDATLPFSTTAVTALRAARARAREAGAAEVEPADVLVESARALPEPLPAGLAEAGYAPERLRGGEGEAAHGAIALEANLFHHYSQVARRLVSRAGRAAHGAGEPSIGPARLVLAALEAETGLEARSGLTRSRARLVLEGRTADPAPPPDRALRPDPPLAELIGALPAGAQSLDVLAALHRDPASELTQAFLRQKVSEALLERARGAFEDP